ncbi:AMP-dependent synthetase [Acidihalobacter yilgarnensis]|uniref:AMP-dependent synthetase n=1 Tax=Acidihalobacter yilgarnensis TaxID=2819280 RepID=A0A1D8ISJ6_9GAMM|nr:long-chain fatty acid--CoA ligase [Acidihalobacter yilgarnensis]AOU99383.1 AMP-dependent synthetase [Acidihalobacter yilgarnensis]
MVSQTDLIRLEEAGNLSGLFHERVRRTPDRAAYTHFDAGSQTWVDTTWREMALEVGRWQAAMHREGLQPGDRVAIMLRNAREWVVLDQAALGLGLVTVPLYTDDRPDNVAHIVEETGARLLVVNGRRQWRHLQEVQAGFNSLKRIVSLGNIEMEDGARDKHLESFAEWSFGCHGEPQRSGADVGELASIVYTSGTAGRPKGVMLTHGNLLGNAWAVCDVEPLYADDVFLSFLPLSHTLERTGGYYFPMFYGARVAYARSVQQLGEDLRAVRPTVLISVPRVYERLHARITKNLSRKSPLARGLFELAVNVGARRYERSLGLTAWRPSQWLWPVLDHLVASKIREQLGGRLRFAVCGGAALAPRLAREFSALGIPVLQGYGLTEASPVVSVNRPADNRFDSIGAPLKGVEVRIGADSELLVRGPNVMRGYWQDEEATRIALKDTGWLRTGDQVRQDEAGRLYITGRIKDIIVLNNGEKVPPSEMETAICLDELFDQVVVAGEGRPYLSALVVLNPEAWPAFAAACDVDPADPEALLDRFVERRLLQRIGRALHDFPGYAQIRRLSARLEPWTLEEGLMTPTQKLKRRRILTLHENDLNRLYEGNGDG